VKLAASIAEQMRAFRHTLTAVVGRGFRSGATIFYQCCRLLMRLLLQEARAQFHLGFGN
jgi:hypothetical protein